MQTFRSCNNMQLDHTHLFGKQRKLDKQFDSNYSIFLISPVSASRDDISNYFPYIIQCSLSMNCKLTSFILVSTSISSWSLLQDWLKYSPKTYCQHALSPSKMGANVNTPGSQWIFGRDSWAQIRNRFPNISYNTQCSCWSFIVFLPHCLKN